MRDLKVLARLAAPLALLLALMVLALAVAFVGMRSGAEQVSRLESESVPLFNTATTMRVAHADGAVAIRDFVSLADVGAQREARKALAASEKAYADGAAALGKLAAAGQGDERLRALAAQLQASQQKVAAQLRAALDLADNAEFQQAQDTVYKQVRPLQAEAATALQTLVTMANARVAERAETARVEARRGELRLLAVLLVALALGAGAVVMIKRNFARPLNLAVEVAERVADGDLRASGGSGRGDETGRVLAALSSMQLRLNALVRAIRHSAEAVADASERIAAGNGELAARTEEQASSLEETAASVEELSAVVRQNSDFAVQASGLAQSAAQLAQEGSQAVGGVQQTMQDIQRSARKVADIVGLMDEIAFQTNLLALNAAVEAARAGEQGRGFAVVAAQVRLLAQRSGEASREIKQLVGESVQQADRGNVAAARAGASMDKSVQVVGQVAGLMAQIAQASREQGAGIEQVNATVAQLDTVTQSNASLVQEVNGHIDSLLQQSRELVDAASRFRLEESAPADARRHAPVLAWQSAG